MHSTKSGVCHRSFLNDIEAIASTRELLGLLPSSSWDKREPRIWTKDDEIN
jgi:acetyl-CoA carboxylase carboxyltransferase component